MQPIDLLAIAAHPDDVELGCAGTMLMAKRDGKRTAIVDCTRGELSTRGTLQTRAAETDAASKILQLDYRKNLEIPDGNIEISADNLKRVITEIRRLRPSIMLAPSPEERHPDHEAAAELAHRAAFYAGLQKYVTTDESGQIQTPHRPLLVLHFMQTYTFLPSVIVDISPVFEDRMRAVHAFGSQFDARDKSLPETFLTQEGFVDGIQARAITFGRMIGVSYAEPLWSHEPLGTRDLFSLVTKKIA